MVATAPELDMDVVQKFAFKVFGDITAAQMAPLSAVADRLGLFQKLAEGELTVSRRQDLTAVGLERVGPLIATAGEQALCG